MFVRVYSCQNTTLFEITCCGSYGKKSSHQMISHEYSTFSIYSGVKDKPHSFYTAVLGRIPGSASLAAET